MQITSKIFFPLLHRRYSSASDEDTEHVADLEDLAGPARRGGGANGEAGARGGQATTSGRAAAGSAREMLTPALRASLSKQGYKLIGAAHRIQGGCGMKAIHDHQEECLSFVLSAPAYARPTKDTMITYQRRETVPVSHSF